MILFKFKKENIMSDWVSLIPKYKSENKNESKKTISGAWRFPLRAMFSASLSARSTLHPSVLTWKLVQLRVSCAFNSNGHTVIVES